MSNEPLTNAAVEFTRRSFDYWNSLEDPPAIDPATLPDGFVSRGSTINFGRVDEFGSRNLFVSGWAGLAVWTDGAPS